MDKYYTPALEDFFHGLELQTNWGNEGDWKNEVFDQHHGICDLGELLDVFRIKYLDKKDIEELGWIYVEFIPNGDGDSRWFNEYSFKGGFYRIFSWGHIESLGDNLLDRVTIKSHGGETTLFDGKIKNKSELKRILKMLGI